LTPTGTAASRFKGGRRALHMTRVTGNGRERFQSDDVPELTPQPTPEAVLHAAATLADGFGGEVDGPVQFARIQAVRAPALIRRRFQLRGHPTGLIGSRLAVGRRGVEAPSRRRRFPMALIADALLRPCCRLSDRRRRLRGRAAWGRGVTMSWGRSPGLGSGLWRLQIAPSAGGHGSPRKTRRTWCGRGLLCRAGL